MITMSGIALLLVAAPNPDLLVSARWLAGHRTDAEVVILHVARDQADFDRGHVPGARFLPARSLWVTTGPGVELPTVAQIDSVFESVGVSNGSRVILYGDTWTTPRAFLALDYIGLGDRAALLDGGLSAWRADGQPVSTEAPGPARPGTIAPRPNPDIVADATWLEARLKDPSVTLLDARSPAEYAGTTEAERLPRFGHIPGAKNVPWTETFSSPSAADSGRATPLLDGARLAEMLERAGAGPGKQVVTYCTVGLRASHLYYVARLLGYRPRIYDGSMRDWSPRSDFPVVGPPPKPASPPEESRPFLRTIDWLHHHGADPDVVILHADRNRASYDSAHVDGARFVPVSAFVVERDGLPTELPPAERLDSLLESLGITDQTRHIVLTGDILAASRLFFTLDYLGLGERAGWLDGGVAGWRAGGHPVSAESPPPAARGTLTVRPRPEIVVTAPTVRNQLTDPAFVVIDARKPDEYAGTAKEDGVDRPGHLPGSTNLEWSTLFSNGSLRPARELDALFRAAGADPGKTVVALCRVGTRASALYLAARSAGYRVVLYDGSMVDWSRRTELPVATGRERGRP